MKGVLTFFYFQDASNGELVDQVDFQLKFPDEGVLNSLKWLQYDAIFGE